jgi:hypothetical protein
VGLANALNQWKVRDPSLAVPDYDVKPGAPDDSFLIYKISDPQLELLPPDPDGAQGPEVGAAGAHMPLSVTRLSEDEMELLEDWVTAGAPNGPFMDGGDRLTPQVRLPQMRNFAADIQPIFGVEAQLNADHGVCRATSGSCAHCVYCHYAGSPNPLDLSDPFGPNGLVNVNSVIRPALKRVSPGNPSTSVLILKVRQTQPTTAEYGAQMPYSYLPLTQDQVDLVRQWILDGARR